MENLDMGPAISGTIVHAMDPVRLGTAAYLVLLFVKAGTLHYLEYVSHSDDQPESWPDPSRLRTAL